MINIDGLINDFPMTSDKELSEKYNVTKGQINYLRKKYNLKKHELYIKQSYELRALKIAIKATGRKVSEETKTKTKATKQKNGTVLSGENHYRWKGGKPWERFKAPEYIAWRIAVLERDNYTCQGCNKKCKKHEKGLSAHHIKEYAAYPEHRFDVDNGLTLCRNCHMEIHGRKPKPKDPVPCACGCGTMIVPFDAYGKPRKYVNYHGKKGKISDEKQKQLNTPTIPCACGCGTPIKPFDKNGRAHSFVRGHSSRVNKIKVNIPQDIPCACGCGKMIKSFDQWGQPAKYSRGHNMRNRVVSEEVKEKLRIKARQRWATKKAIIENAIPAQP